MPEVHVVEVQDVVAADLEIDALRETRLAGLPAQVVLLVMPHRKMAEDDVAEERVAEMTGRRHHPAHAQCGADLGGLARLERARADHLLQRDDVGVDRRQHRGDSLRTGTSVEAAAAMDVVGHHPQLPGAGLLVWHQQAD